VLADPPPVSIGKRTAVRVAEWTLVSPTEAGDGNSLVGLTLGDDPRVQVHVGALARAGVVVITELRGGIAIETRSFVGRIVVGPLDLTIVPKVAPERWHTLFAYALRLRGLVRSGVADAPVQATTLQDMLILQLVAEARELIGRGLHREYVRQRAALASPRGRIDLQRIATRGGIREQAIPCRFTRRIDDFPLNRALLAGLRSAAALATDVNLRSDAHRLAHELDATVESVPLDKRLLTSAREALDRRTVRYEPVLDLIELLNAGQSVSLSDDPESSRIPIRGFAFDMNALWQRLLGRVLAEWGTACEVRSEVSLRGVITQDPAFSPKRRALATPRPDFGIYRGGTLIAYLDAKYRDLWETALPREMMYQLALYAAAQERGAAAMLYPTEAYDAREERLLVNDPATGSPRASVALRPVLLATLEELISMSPSVQRDRARASFAHALCGLAASDRSVTIHLENSK
jgi:5-methylcytosine-specific restriction enzyme subunit McrC